MSDDPKRQPADEQSQPGDRAVAAWLAQHGLAEHAPMFVRERIGLDVLGDLTDADLRALGVQAWGDRRRILNAAAALRAPAGQPGGDASPPPAATSHTASSPAPASAPPGEAGVAERRQLTVMFCDLVGSTDLAAALDPEDYRALLLQFHDAIAQSASAWSGQVAQLLGDGALVYFGHPVAHEDDAVRAVHAALTLVRRVAGMPAVSAAADLPAARMQVRVGVATGLVVLGEIGGGALPAETSASGSTPNLAARLQAVAEPGGIVVDDRCRELLGGHFELAALEALTLKGYAGPMRAWRVLGVRDGATRYALTRAASAAPLIGRAAERGMLERHAARVMEGRGQALLLAGEAGLGKSRLCAAFVAQWQAGGGISLALQASPYFTDTALHPVAAALRRAMAADAPPGADPAAMPSDRWRTPAALGPGHAQRVVAWLDMQAGLRETSVIAGDQKALLLESLCAWMLALADEAPLAILLEDVHWIDATTEEWMARLASRLADRRLLLLLTTRPEYDGKALAAAGASRLTLSRLDPDESAALVRAAAGQAVLEGALAEAIVRRADGNPLFLEELTRAVCAGSALAGTTEVPATLGDSMTARLDRAPQHKPLVRMAAVVGREFSEAVLAAALDRPQAGVAADLEALSATDLVVRGEAPGLWMFRHALLRDAAYQSLLRARRAQAHATVAQALAQVDPAAAARRPELFAFHRQEAGETALARELWMRAGDRSAAEAAFREAAAHYRAALRLLDGDDESAQRHALELKLLMRLGTMLGQSDGFTSSSMLDCFSRARARALAERMHDAETFVAASAAMGGVLLSRGQPDEVEPLFRPLTASQVASLSLRNRLNRDAILAIAMSQAGDQRRAWPMMLATRDELIAEWPGARRTPGVLFRTVNLLVHAAYAALLQGRMAEADDLSRDALDRASETGDGAATAYALGSRAMVLTDLGRSGEGRGLAERALTISRTQGLGPWLILASMSIGLIAVDQGAIDEGLAPHRAALEAWHREQGVFHCGEFCAQMAERLLRAGRPAEAAAYVHDGERFLRGLTEQVYAAELLRLRARLHELDGDAAAAEQRYGEAIALADRQGAGRLALRAAAGLSRLWLAQGQPARVLGLLAPQLEASLLPHAHPEWLDARTVLERAHAVI